MLIFRQKGGGCGVLTLVRIAELLCGQLLKEDCYL